MLMHQLLYDGAAGIPTKSPFAGSIATATLTFAQAGQREMERLCRRAASSRRAQGRPRHASSPTTAWTICSACSPAGASARSPRW